MTETNDLHYYVSKDKFTDWYFSTHEPDLKIQVKDEVINVHKIILIMQSPVLKTMIQDCNQDSILTLDCNPKIFKILINMLSYNNRKDINIEYDELIDLINMADFYHIDELLCSLQKEFNEYDITEKFVYEVYKKIKYKPLRDECLNKIHNFLIAKKSENTNILLETITDGDDLVHFIDQTLKLIKLIDKNYEKTNLFEIINSWKDIHLKKKNNTDKNIETYYCKLLAMIDINNLSTSSLIDHGTSLYNNLGKEYVKTLLKKLKKYTFN